MLRSDSIHRVWPSVLVHVLACVLSAIAAGKLATNGRSDVATTTPIVVAAIASLITILPSAILRNLILHGGIRHLVAIAWRLPMSFASLLLLVCWDGLQRKCYLWALVTCYFVSLTLESWLQIRQAKSTTSS